MANMLELIGRIRMDSAQAEGAIGRVTKGTDGLSISSRKAESAVKNFASIIRSGQEPVTALADSVGNLTRAFGLGVGATVAVVGVVEVIKSFISESQKLNQVADSINTTLRNFQANVGSLDFSGAVKQTANLRLAIEDAREKIQKDGGMLSKVGRTIADAFFGGARERAKSAEENLRASENQAKYAAETASSKELELKILQRKSPIDAEELKIRQKYAQIERELISTGQTQQTIANNRMMLAMELSDIERKRNEETKKSDQERIDSLRTYEKEATRIIDLQRKASEEFKSGLEAIRDRAISSASPLIERIVQASENVGILGAKEFVDRRQKDLQKESDRILLEKAGFGTVDGARMISSEETQRLGALLEVQAEGKRKSDEALLNNVYNIGQAVMDLKRIIEERLGVPILRSAAGT